MAVRISERGTRVGFKSPQIDFLETLDFVKGLWARLAYASHLRDDEGEYVHWGLIRCHGGDAARAAMREGHEAVYAELLRTSILKSASELQTSATSAGVKAGEYIERFRNHENLYIPTSMLKNTRRHFTSVVEGLRSLLQNAEHLDA